MKHLINFFKNLLSNRRQALLSIIVRIAPIIPDRAYLRIYYYLNMGKRLSLDNPKTYNEKLQWLKLYNRKSEYTRMVDKVEAKDYVASIIGEEHIIPTLGVWNRVEDIDWDTLPNQFVLKCTHDSGGLVICKDKSKLSIETAKQELKKGIKRKYFYRNREWPYKNVIPRIIGEKYMVDESGYELKDYKWFCFNGEPKALFVASDRGKIDEETKFDFFDVEFNHLPLTNGHPNSTRQILKPQGFDEMKRFAAKLSQGMPHVRIDFYDINGKIYFGEITFFHWSGVVPFNPEEWDYKFGEWIKLPNKNS